MRHVQASSPSAWEHLLYGLVAMAGSERMTVVDAIEKVKSDRFLLPGIQRSFVWSTKQIEALFDSLLRDYPIGSLLLWDTRPADHPQLRFRRFVTDYAGKNTAPVAARPPKSARVAAVLDGQQRLTALNIGIRGTHAASERGAARRLYLDLDYQQTDAGAELDEYRFQFLADGARADGAWFSVCDAVGLTTDAASLSEAIRTAGHKPTPERRQVLKALAVALNVRRAVKLETEHASDLDRVLNIFARSNTGGTQLTYVELLVSTATARWRKLDAAKEISELRQKMNTASPEGFRFTPDRIVKSGLVLLDTKEPKFHVESFMKGNRAQRLEDMWPQFQQSMTVAAQLLHSFGLSGSSVPAENVVIPIAYYVHHRRLKPSFATAHAHEKDRARVRAFVARTLLQRRYWTGVVDPVLVAARDAIKSHGSRSFPLDRIEEKLSTIKSIEVTDGLLDELAVLRYGDRRTFTLLRLLFPHMVHHGPSSGGLDKDHVFPLGKFNATQLRQADIDVDQLDRLRGLADLLPNLQLLRAEDNQGGGKSAKLPKDWLSSLSATSKRRYTQQGVKHLPAGLAGFEDFYAKRQELLRKWIKKLLVPS